MSSWQLERKTSRWQPCQEAPKQPCSRTTHRLLPKEWDWFLPAYGGTAYADRSISSESWNSRQGPILWRPFLEWFELRFTNKYFTWKIMENLVAPSMWNIQLDKVQSLEASHENPLLLTKVASYFYRSKAIVPLSPRAGMSNLGSTVASASV